jgi:putative transposase
VAGLGIAHVLPALRSPWQNAYAARVIGCIRRECLDQGIVFGAGHRRRVLAGYCRYCHRWRTHRSLEMDGPDARPVQPPEWGQVLAVPEVGGLHHHDERVAA